MTTLRCVTVKQPWAYAMTLESGKDVENRAAGALGWKHRGDTVLHAGRGWSERGAVDPRIVELLGGRPEPGDPRFTYGACIGVFDLEDVHVASGCCEPWGEMEYWAADGHLQRVVTHLRIDNMRPIDPVPCRGRLGIWFPPRPVEATIEQQLWRASRG